MRQDAVVALFPALAQIELDAWIERRWVRPEPATGGGWEFQEIDVARVRLIYELRYELALADDSLPVVLSLTDQLHALRGRLKSVLGAIEAQPEPVRAAILAALGQE